MKQTIWRSAQTIGHRPSIITRKFTRAVSLRPYQEQCIEASLASFQKGTNRIAVSLATGSGKTGKYMINPVIFINLINRLLMQSKQSPKPKILVLAHRKELLFQPFRYFERHFPDIKVSIEQGNKRCDADSDVVLASIATLGGANQGRISRFNPDEFGMIVIDEAHHASAKMYQNILQYFKVYNEGSTMKVYGCSATLRRHDGISLYPTFEEIAYTKTVFSMLEEGWLCDIKVSTVNTSTSLDGVKSISGDYSTKMLAQTCNTQERNSAVLKVYINHAQKANCHSTIIFAINVAHIDALVTMFQSNGIDARGVSGLTNSLHREVLINEFSLGKFPVLVNCGIITEGVDIPCIDCVILARPTKSGVLLQQMIGRGMRKHPDKQYCHVFDIVDSLRDDFTRSTVPTLLGLDTSFQMDGTSLMDVMQEIESEKQKIRAEIRNVDGSVDASVAEYDPLKISITITPFTNPFQIASVKSDSVYLKKVSKYAWVRVGESKWVISLKPSQTLHLTREETGMFTGTLRNQVVRAGKTGKSHYVVNTNIANNDTLQSAFQALDTFLGKSLRGFELTNLKLNAIWRTRMASDAQLKILGVFNIVVDDGTLTQGEASDLITRRKFGAIAGQKKAMITARKQRKRNDAEDRMMF